MVLEVSGYLLFLLYEFSIFVACLNIFYRIGKNEDITTLKLIVLVIATSMVVSSLISTMFSFLQIHSLEYYLLAAVALAAALSFSVLKNDFRQYRIFVSSLINSVFESFASRKNLVFLLLLLPLLFNIIKLPGDIDSLAVMNSILPIAGNQINPYVFYYNYVAFWELSYIPSMAITGSDSFFWLDSIKPVILIGLGSYMVGRTLGIPKFLASVLAFSGILFFHFWMPEGSSGISTLKNDMVFGAGIVFLAYYFIRGKTRPGLSNFIIFLLGSVFVLNKYSGVPVLLFSVALLVWMHRENLPEKIRRPHVWLYAAAIMATAGHYYLKNLVLFQNPFYPIKFVIAGVGFENGLYDLSGTSILSSLANPDLWGYVSPTDPLKAALFVPIYLGIAAVFSFLVYGTVRRPRKSLESRHLYAALFILGAWVLYLNSGWSASAYGEDLAYISTLNSLRYVEGLVVLTDVFLVFVLWKAGIPPKILGALVLAHASVRILGLYSYMFYGGGTVGTNFDLTLLALPCVFVLALLAIRDRISNLSGRLVVLLFATAAVFVFSPYLLESNKAYWMIPYNDIIFETYYSEGSNIALISEPTAPFSYYMYPFAGNRFQHDVAVLTEEQFHDEDGRLYFAKSDSYLKPDYVVAMCDHLVPCSEDLKALSATMNNYGYSAKKISDHGLVLQARQ